jgi:hypothetical protein
MLLMNVRIFMGYNEKLDCPVTTLTTTAKTTELAGFTASPVPSETFIKSNIFDYVPNEN